jgi:gentisate 1,2-dioxygenase
MTIELTPSPVKIVATDAPDQPTRTPELERLYRDFEQDLLVPLWTEIGDLMPQRPTSRAHPHVWRWSSMYPLAERAGDIVPVGRGGERRAIALANPGLGGRPFATSTLWAAIQYLNPGEVAPEHRHTQNAFRFVIEGEGVWTVVNGDPIAMRRGDFLPQAGWNWHGHHNVAQQPMAWLDGLDIPFVHATDTAFFEFGPEEVTSKATPEKSSSERLWAHPGLLPVSQPRPTVASPIGAYRWEYTDAALRQQLELEDEGQPGVVEPGHAAVRFANPATGDDVLPTIRAEMHRLRVGAQTAQRREVGSSVWQVFEGRGTVSVGGRDFAVERGDLVSVPSWQPLVIGAETDLDLFRFSDTPVFERLHQDRVEVAGRLVKVAGRPVTDEAAGR